jgi:high-affinity nickel-transport protein
VIEPALFALVFALGLRHGMDPDHLIAVDGLSRFKPNPWNGVIFAVGHGCLITLLAVPLGALLHRSELENVSVWVLLVMGLVNLYRLLRPESKKPLRLPTANPLLLGMLFAIGFETASQLSALALAARAHPVLLGMAFTLGMVITDGIDGFLASRLQREHGVRAAQASKTLGWLVVAMSFALVGLELGHVDLETFALPLGLSLFAVLVGLRLYALSWQPAS